MHGCTRPDHGLKGITWYLKQRRRRRCLTGRLTGLRGPAQVKAVKAALHVSTASAGAAPLCREAQLRELEAALQALAVEGRGGALYVSGLPGTGRALAGSATAR